MTVVDSWLFEVELWGFRCSCTYPKVVLVFLARSATTELGSQKVKFTTIRLSATQKIYFANDSIAIQYERT